MRGHIKRINIYVGLCAAHYVPYTLRYYTLFTEMVGGININA